MPVPRATFFFKNNNGAGWSETLFIAVADLDIALERAKVIASWRVNCQGVGSRLEFIRVSDDLVKRDSKIYPVPAGDQTSHKRESGDADIASTCLLVRCESGVVKRRSLFLRGVPDDITKDNGRYRPSAEFQQAFDQYVAAVKANNGSIKVRKGIGVLYNISNVSSADANGNVTITTSAPNDFVPNDVVNIRGVLGATQVRGLQRVLTAPTTTTFTIRVNRIVRPYIGGGNVQHNDYELFSINNMVPVRCSHHNAGRPFDSPRGRRLVH